MKFRNLWDGPHGGFVKYAAAATAAVLLWIGFFGEDNLVRWARAGIELRRQRNQIENYSREIESMDKQIRMLSNDRDTLEEFARENFHFAAPGDDVYLMKK
jgi:cell division protein FtsB